MSKYSVKKIAELSNVSTATVSRVLNNPASVSEAKRNKVLEIIEKTNYTPNQVARSLFTNSSKIVGYIVPNITNPFFSELGRYLEQTAFDKGYHVVLCNSNNSYEKEKFYIKNLEAMNADGIIIITNNTHLTHKTILPKITIDRDLESENNNSISIRSDHYKSGEIATNHLYSLGCRNIAFLGPFNRISSGKLRYKGYEDFCVSNNLDIIKQNCSYSFEDGIKQAKTLIKKNNKIDGIICANDIIAMACYKILFENSIKVPTDIKIIGYDNILGSHQVTPALTTIAQPIENIAETTINYIIQMIEKKEIKNRQVIFPVKLIERETT